MTILTNDFAVKAAAENRTTDDQTAIATVRDKVTPSTKKGDIATTSPLDGQGDRDLELYLRHVEGGESIRSIARDVGCHASTVLRRIRRVEARRDDPLVDRALDAAVPGSPDSAPKFEPARFTRSEAEQFRRILRRLAESGAQLILADAMEKAIVVRDEVRIAILDRRLGEKMALHGWVVLESGGRISRYVISALGRATLKRMIARRGGGMPLQAEFAGAKKVGGGGMQEAAAVFDHADQHRVWAEADIKDPETGKRRRTRINAAESPLQLLARRRDADGKPFLSPELVTAGERLREDFELSQLGPRVTQNWDRFLTAGADTGRSGGSFGGGSESARDRVGAALRELGPGMGDLCLRVCCFLEGVEMTERRLGWSARSGKIVLRLALMRLEKHYRETYGAGSPLIG